MLRLAALVILYIATVQAVGYYYKKGGVPGNDVHRVARARFNQRGVIGEAVFVQERKGAPVDIALNLMGLDQFTDSYRWSIHEYPVRSSLLFNYPCTNDQLGGVLGAGLVSGNETAVGDLTSSVGYISHNMNNMQRFSTPNLTLYSDGTSIIGRSLVIDRQDGPNGNFICANIEASSTPGGRVRTLRATFNNGIIQGDVIIRSPEGFDIATIEADIHRIDGGTIPSGTVFPWSINFGPAASNCAGVRQVYGSAAYNPDHFMCSMTNQRQCIIGDLTSKCGPLVFNNDLRARAFCADSQLGTVNSGSLKGLIVRIGDNTATENRTLGCATLNKVRPITATSYFRGPNEVVDITLFQDAPDDQTYLKAYVSGLKQRKVPYSLWLYSGVGPESDPCNTTYLDPLYRVPGRALFPSSSGVSTDDSCTFSNFLGALPIDGTNVLSRTVSTSLPLFGPFSVIGRTVALADGNGNIVACSPIRDACTTCVPLPFNSILGYQNLNFP